MHARSQSFRIYPFLKKVKPHINRGYILVFSQRAEHCHLTIVHLAQSAQPLPGNTNRPFSLFKKSTFIYQKASIVVITQKFINILGHMINYIS